MTSPAISFSSAQQRVIDARGKNLIVSASAGAGKTAVLVERLCTLVIQDRIPISSILAMTFTEDAASEMKTRLKERLEKCDQSDPWIARQLSDLETASISTIHSFCLDVVKEDYYLAGLSYSMANHVDNGLADEQAMEKALSLAFDSLPAIEASQLKLYLESFGKKETDLRQLVLKFLEIARSKPDARAWMESCRKPNPAATPWFLAWFSMRIEALIEIFEEMIDTVERMSFQKLAKQQEYAALFEGKRNALQVCAGHLEAGDYHQFGHSFIEYIETTGKFTPTINKIKFEGIQKDSRDLEKEIAQVLFTQAQFDQIEQEVQPIRKAFVDLALKAQEEFARLKAQAGFIDFADMEQFAWQIVSNPIAAKKLRDRYAVILIDEYQDTNDLQEAIIQAIARSNNVFRVGDQKQSIYGFRQAKPALMKGHIANAGPMDEVIAMQENYRSTARLIRFNNHFFENLMNVSGLEAQFGPADAAKPGTPAQSEGRQAPVRFLYTLYDPPAQEDEVGQPVEKEKLPIVARKSLHRKNRADLIAQDILRKVEAGQVSFRDVAILSRSSTPHEELKNALESWGIRAIHHMKKGFYTNKSVQIVLSALRMIHDPRNDIALMAALCSPLTGLKQEDILPLLKNREEGQSLYQALHNSPQGYKMLEIVRIMQPWKSLPLAEIIVRIYGYHHFYDGATTSQDKTNLDLLLQKAAQAEDLLDLDEFLESTTLEENLDKTSEAIPFAREEDAVTLSTIHASKGLQYKLVYILSEQTNRDMDASSPITFDQDLGLSLDGLDFKRQLKEKSGTHLGFAHKRFLEDLQEKMRLLYVACTRAREELVFVDTLAKDDLYDWDLNTRALLNNDGFTSWFFHVFHRQPGLDVHFEEKELIERPDHTSKSARRFSMPRYRQKAMPISSQTASEAKLQPAWPQDANLNPDSARARERGTLLHEMAGKLSYPYQEGDIAAMASQAGLPFAPEDTAQLQALNTDEHYARWMNLPHQFECPYVAMDHEAIIHGFMDLVVFDGDTIHIVDFKSDRAFDGSSLIRKYAGQLDTYEKAMTQIEPKRKIAKWIYSFALSEMIQLP